MYHRSQNDPHALVMPVWGSLTAIAPAAALGASTTADFAIIGGGICGLIAARVLAQRGAGVVVVDKGPIGWGASGRNAGFACLGASFLSLETLIQTYGEAQARAFWRVQADGIAAIAQCAHDNNQDFNFHGQGLTTFAHSLEALGGLRQDAQVLRRWGYAVRLDEAAALSAQARRAGYFGALVEATGFGLDPQKYVHTLARLARDAGARLYAHTPALALAPDGGRFSITTPGGAIRARKVLIAGNGWTDETLHPALRGQVLPILSNIVTTAPLDARMLAAIPEEMRGPAQDSRRLLTYWRVLPDGRLLLGGRGDTTGGPMAGARMRRALERRIAAFTSGADTARTTHFWRGFIAATRRQTPVVSALDAEGGVYAVYGCHGSGVGFMTWAGQAVAQTMLGDPVTLPAPVCGLSPAFPWALPRLWQLRAVLAQAAIADRWG